GPQDLPSRLVALAGEGAPPGPGHAGDGRHPLGRRDDRSAGFRRRHRARRSQRRDLPPHRRRDPRTPRDPPRQGLPAPAGRHPRHGPAAGARERARTRRARRPSTTREDDTAGRRDGPRDRSAAGDRRRGADALPAHPCRVPAREGREDLRLRAGSRPARRGRAARPAERARRTGRGPHLAGYGTLPAHIVRTTLLGQPPGSLRDRGEDHPDEVVSAFYRRLYMHPRTGDLVGMESRSRAFPAGLARMLRWRDTTCRTPWCNATIRHHDHVIPHHRGGPTSFANGQGLCIRCNLRTELGLWILPPLTGTAPARDTDPTGTADTTGTTDAEPTTRAASRPPVPPDPGTPPR